MQIQKKGRVEKMERDQRTSKRIKMEGGRVKTEVIKMIWAGKGVTMNK